MSFFTSLITLILATLIQGLMQLSSGVFATFYHYALGKKSRKKADDFSLYFILGTEIFIAATFLILCIFIFTFYNQIDSHTNLFSWILAGIFAFEALFSFFFYYRKGKTTELSFIPRFIEKNLTNHISNIKTRSDAFVLGFISNIPELIFTLPIYIFLIINLIDFDILPRTMIIILYVVATIFPPILTFSLYHSGHNFADIARLRLRYKPLVRFSLPIIYILLTIILILGTHHG